MICVTRFLLVASLRLRQISQKHILACAGFGSWLVTTPLPQAADNDSVGGGQVYLQVAYVMHSLREKARAAVLQCEQPYGGLKTSVKAFSPL